MAKQSPYQKYGKTPFRYEHPNCKHSRSVEQSLPATKDRDGWRGLVCASCNVIVRKYDGQRRFAAEAA